ncbi:MAG: homocysteine S-methyltransferase family protein, partial [Clostridia bacterium]|nr:homocysteine S-methyltransferase family protein [Clostridia bacterium]
MNILEKIESGFLLFDGAMGTMLIKGGLKPGEIPEKLCITDPDRIINIHRAYLDAGCDVVSANTFGANPFKFDNYEEIIRAAMDCANEAVNLAKAESDGRDCYVALDIGSTGEMLKPAGDLEFEDAVEAFAKVINAGKDGADVVLIETMNDLYELRAAVLAAKENCGLPVIASVVFNEKKTLMTGADPAAVVAMLEGLGVDALGMNCSLGPKQLKNIVPDILKYASVPVIVQPNAGIPAVVDGKTVYDVTPGEFVSDVAEIAQMGARILGGCCGTSPEYIKLLREKLNTLTPVPFTKKNHTLVSSYTHAVDIKEVPVLIGERINPTGKPKFKQALRDGDIDYIMNEAFSQTEKGVHILDVNVGLPEIDEPSVLTETVKRIQAVIDLPLQIDTSDPVALERAMRIYNGKPLVNSVNGKQESMDAVLPLVKKYGGAVVALTLDENGIPDSAEGRLEIAERIVNEAAKYGIDKKDIVVDTLAMA